MNMRSQRLNAANSSDRYRTLPNHTRSRRGIRRFNHVHTVRLFALDARQRPLPANVGAVSDEGWKPEMILCLPPGAGNGLLFSPDALSHAQLRTRICWMGGCPPIRTADNIRFYS
jgi:hypothetical protein